MRASSHRVSRRQAGISGRRGLRAFTVVELMLAVSIMGVIVFALFSVFNQTQRALRATETSGDVSEKARAIVEMISRELEQAQPTFRSYRGIQEINLMGGYEYPPRMIGSDRTDITPRTNFLQNIFFYNSYTNAWRGIGYRVVNVTNGVGQLVRFETNLFGHRPLTNQLSNAFVSEPITNASYHQVADGVIHLAFIPYDSQGYRLGYDTTNRQPGIYSIYRGNASLKNMGNKFSDINILTNANVLLTQGYPTAPAWVYPYVTTFAFKSNAVPAYIDLEFGLLEPETLRQYYTMLQDQNANAANFLARQINKVHLFRQRIPIRTAAQ
jgi:type II secretory pathway pseudopilin PulG